jgi:hypothetical protein
VVKDMEEKRSNLKLYFWGTLFVLYWIVFPIMYITKEPTPGVNDIFTVVCTGPLSLLTLWFVLDELFGRSTIYEIDRMKRWWNIAILLLPSPFETVIILIAFILLIEGKHIPNPETSLTVVLFGSLFLILAMKWYTESKKGVDFV